MERIPAMSRKYNSDLTPKNTVNKKNSSRSTSPFLVLIIKIIKIPPFSKTLKKRKLPYIFSQGISEQLTTELYIMPTMSQFVRETISASFSGLVLPRSRKRKILSFELSLFNL